jgi:hypothetical protein
MKTISWLFVAAQCCLFANAASAQVSGLRLEAEVVRIGKGTGPARLEVRLVNTGKEQITVVTARLRVRVEQAKDTEKFTVGLEMIEKRMHGGRLVVPSSAVLELVKLLPGEVALINPTTLTNPPDVWKAVNGSEGKGAITVVYEISEFWGERLGVWRGKISGTTTVPK